MKLAVTTFYCDLCGFSSMTEGEFIPYAIQWMSAVRHELMRIERHYCEKCHRTEVQPLLVKEHKR